MSKRFSDSDKWTKNKWFRKLSTKHKLFWIYLLDTCDNVGVWEEDVELAAYLISEPLNKEEVLKVFNEQIKIINGGKKWWIRKFVDFQYGILDINNIKNRPHQCFIKTLMRHRLWIDYQKNLDSPKEKEKDKEKDKEEEKEKDNKGIIKGKEIFNYWNNGAGIKHQVLDSKIKQQINITFKDYTVEQIKQGIDNYKFIRESPDHLDGKKWALIEFLKQANGLAVFLDIESVKDRYKKESQKTQGGGYGKSRSHTKKYREDRTI